jgi:hypothetical protein
MRELQALASRRPNHCFRRRKNLMLVHLPSKLEQPWIPRQNQLLHHSNVDDDWRHEMHPSTSHRPPRFVPNISFLLAPLAHDAVRMTSAPSGLQLPGCTLDQTFFLPLTLCKSMLQNAEREAGLESYRSVFNNSASKLDFINVGSVGFQLKKDLRHPALKVLPSLRKQSTIECCE